jgi:hypothetical protein
MIVRDAEGMISRFILAVLNVFDQQQCLIKKHLFRLGLAHAVLIRTFAGIALVPVETGYLRQIDHILYIATIYIACKWSPRAALQDPRYCEKDRVRLKLALRGKRLGFSLIEIREVLDLYDTRHDGSVRQLERLLEILADKRANLERQLEDIRIMQRELDQVEERC